MTDLEKIPEPLRSYFDQVRGMDSFRLPLEDWRHEAARSDDPIGFWRRALDNKRCLLSQTVIGRSWEGMRYVQAYAAEWMPKMGEVKEWEWLELCKYVQWQECIEEELAALLAHDAEETAKEAACEAAERQRLKASNCVIRSGVDLLRLYRFLRDNGIRHTLFNYEPMAFYLFLDNNKLLAEPRMTLFCRQMNEWYGKDASDFKPFDNKNLSPYSMLGLYRVEEWEGLAAKPSVARKIEKKPGLADNILRIRKLYLELQSRMPPEGFPQLS